QSEKEKARLSAEIQKLQADLEKQTQELLHRVADSQLKEAATREELERQKREKDKLNAAIAASLKEAYTKEEQIKRFEEEISQLNSRCTELSRAHEDMERLKSQCDELMRRDEEARAKEELWKTSQSQLTAAFHNLQNELVKLQNGHSAHDAERSQKE